MNATSDGAKRTTGRYRLATRWDAPHPVCLDRRGWVEDQMDPYPGGEVHGNHEATDRRQAEHQEGVDGGAQETHDLQAAALGPAGSGPAGLEGEASRRFAGACPRGPDPAAALRAGQVGEHPRPLEHGEVGADPGAPAFPVDRRTAGPEAAPPSRPPRPPAQAGGRSVPGRLA